MDIFGTLFWGGAIFVMSVIVVFLLMKAIRMIEKDS